MWEQLREADGTGRVRPDEKSVGWMRTSQRRKRGDADSSEQGGRKM